jgi:hypothetical protein
VDHHKECFGYINSCTSNAWEIWSDDVVRDESLGGLQALIHGLGLEWNAKAVRDFIDPSLWSG